jgi:RimJ/RimL family protein N-acetyltransferase
MRRIAPGKDIQPLGGINIRSATGDDACLLWHWANDPVTRSNSFSTEPIAWDAHQQWYGKKLGSLDCRLWVMELEKIPVAQIRYERISPDTAEISFSVAAHMRGRGLGTLLLEMTTPMASRELGIKWVRGIALRDNHASQRAFAKACFAVTGHHRIANRECVVFTAAVHDRH